MKTLNKEDLKQRWHPKFKFGLGLTGETLDPIIDKFYGGFDRYRHKVEYTGLEKIYDITHCIVLDEIYHNLRMRDV